MLAFADDLVLIAPSAEELQSLLNAFYRFCQENNLEINIGKTEAMLINCNQKLYVNGVEIKTVREFKYLGLYMFDNVVSPEKLL